MERFYNIFFKASLGLSYMKKGHKLVFALKIYNIFYRSSQYVFIFGTMEGTLEYILKGNEKLTFYAVITFYYQTQENCKCSVTKNLD